MAFEFQIRCSKPFSRFPVYNPDRVISKGFRKSCDSSIMSFRSVARKVIILRPCCNYVEKLWTFDSDWPCRNYIKDLWYFDRALMNGCDSCGIWCPVGRTQHMFWPWIPRWWFLFMSDLDTFWFHSCNSYTGIGYQVVFCLMWPK